MKHRISGFRDRYVKCMLVTAGVVLAGCIAARAEQVTEAQMLDMATRAAGFTETYEAVPMIVYTDTDQSNYVTAAEFYYMMARWLRWFYNNGENATPPSTVGITRNIAGPSSPSGVESGTIQKADMLFLGDAGADFIDSNLYVPNYTSLSGTHYTPDAMFFAMARTIRWYAENSGTFPNYTTMLAVTAPDSWTGGSTPPPETAPPAYPWAKSFTVPYTEQPDSYTCGPTSLRMMMMYYGTTYSVSTISSYMASIGDSPYYDGVGRPAILSAAKHYGFSSAVDTTGWTNLKTAIQNNKPCITHIQISPGNYPLYYPSGNAAYVSYSGGHYVVCCGLGADSDGYVTYAVVNDPARGQGIKYSGLSFQTAWGQTSYHFIKLN